MTGTFSQLVPVMNFAGMLILGGVIVFIQWRQGTTKASQDGLQVSSEVINAYKEQVAQLKEQLENYRKEMSILSTKVGELTGMLGEREKQNNQLREILTNRNPEMEAFYKEAMSMMGKVEGHFKTTEPILMQVKDLIPKLQAELKHQTEVIESK